MGFMFSCACRWTMTGLLAGALLTPLLRAEPGDADNSHDYPGFPRLPGYVISDYDEDNPAEFAFSVSRPVPDDLDRVETLSVKGHRYVIRYEPGTDGKTPSLLETQKAYEKMALDGGYKLEKTGAVGDVTETFHLTKNGRETWVCLEPGGPFNILTIVEASVPSAVADSPAAPLPIKPLVTETAAPPALPSPRKPSALMASTLSATLPAEDTLYTGLMRDGRVVLPLAFLPGKPDMDADSQPVIDRVAAILKRHPGLQLDIEGHTDNSGSAEANQLLSEQRAVAVQGMLIADKIDRRRLGAVGLGGSQPLAQENTAEGRQKNRRIELVLQKQEESSDPSPNDSAQQKAPVKSLSKVVTQPKPVPDDSRVQEDGAPHGPAPNGTNYYPEAGGGK